MKFFPSPPKLITPGICFITDFSSPCLLFFGCSIQCFQLLTPARVAFSARAFVANLIFQPRRRDACFVVPPLPYCFLWHCPRPMPPALLPPPPPSANPPSLTVLQPCSFISTSWWKCGSTPLGMIGAMVTPRPLSLLLHILLTAQKIALSIHIRCSSLIFKVWHSSVFIFVKLSGEGPFESRAAPLPWVLKSWHSFRRPPAITLLFSRMQLLHCNLFS